MFRASGNMSGKMSWTRFCRNVNAKSLRFYGTHLLSYCQRDVQTRKSLLLQSHSLTASRGFSDSEIKSSKLPMLREDCYEFPSIFRWLKSSFQLQWAVSRIDPNFDMAEFLQGCIKAQELVSQALGDRDYELLEDLVAKDAVESIKNRVEMLTPEQRRRIKIGEDDVQQPIIYEVNVKKEAGNVQILEIMVVTKYMKDFDPKKLEGAAVSDKIKAVVDNSYLCNYNYVRKYKDDIASDWGINFINHYHFNPFKL